MARRKEFKGIVRNLAHKLNSRNNDYLGYWAAGQVFLLAEERQVDSISFDLLNVKNQLFDESLKLYASSIQHLFREMLAAHKIPLSWLKSAYFIFCFNQPYQNQYHKWRSALGKPYLITLELTSDFGKVYKQTFGGNVNPHDPCKEQRRAGF